MMRRAPLFGPALATLLALSACSGAQKPGGAEQASGAADASPAPSSLPADETPPAPASSSAVAEPGPATPSASATDYVPPALVPEAAKGEKGARNVLLSWAKAVEAHQFRAAYALFGPHGPGNGQSAADFAAAFVPYKTIDVALGDGEIEGAAGSSFYSVPVTLAGTKRDGSAYRRLGTITLRRVNDVPGAAAWELAWHVETVDWQGR